MAVGLPATDANGIVNGLSGTFLKLHVGDPGAAGANNAATEATRKLVTLAAAANGAAATTALMQWTSIAGSQTPTHYSLWTAATAGTFKFSGTLASAGYVAGNTFEIAIGALTITVSTVAA